MDTDTATTPGGGLETGPSPGPSAEDAAAAADAGSAPAEEEALLFCHHEYPQKSCVYCRCAHLENAPPQAEGRRSFKKAKSVQALLLLFVSVIVFSLHLVVMLDKHSWFVQQSGLVHFPGNFPSGRNILSGVYPSVNVCQDVANSMQNVSGFVWSPIPRSFVHIVCEFKSYGTPLELQQKLNRTSVVKLQSNGGCGLWRCENTPVANTEDMYNCEPLRRVVVVTQVLSIALAILMGGHMLYTAFLRTTTYGLHLIRMRHIVYYTHGVQAVMLCVAILMMIVAYRESFCQKRLHHLATLNFGFYFMVANVLCTGACLVLLRSAYVYEDLLKKQRVAEAKAERETHARAKEDLEEREAKGKPPGKVRGGAKHASGSRTHRG